MRKVFLVVLCCTFVASLPVAQAKTGPGNSWTQLENGNWPAESSNPRCGTSSDPCTRWTTNGSRGYFEGLWHFDMPVYGWIRNDASAAIAAWSGQPYRSPVFTHTQAPCGRSTTHICVGAQRMAPNICGLEINDYYSSGIIFHAWVYLNNDVTGGYYDGPHPRQNGCDLRHTYLHEFGHVWSEGHSSVVSALMYPSENTTDQVDSYAQQELASVYGYLANSGSGGTGCASTSDTSIAYCPSAVLDAKARLLSLSRSVLSVPSANHGTV